MTSEQKPVTHISTKHSPSWERETLEACHCEERSETWQSPLPRAEIASLRSQ